MVVKTKKVFIGGLSANSTVEDIKAYFQQFGKVLFFAKVTQVIFQFRVTSHFTSFGFDNILFVLW